MWSFPGRRVVGCLGAVAALVFFCGCGRHEGPGEVTRKIVPNPVVAARAARQKAAVAHLPAPPPEKPKQILFGDLHVHTTFSLDAFVRTLPMMQGEGAHPPADACDFARFCSDLDFFSINDHAEMITPAHWRETKESIRQCNAVAGDARNPDLVAFIGWEWTQVGATPETHYGHKNVIFRDLAEDRVPRRPISALNDLLVGALRRQPPLARRLSFVLHDLGHSRRYFDFNRFQSELSAVPMCPEGVDTRGLPDDCHEAAQTPDVLFEKLSQWGFDTIVIPHGTTWGFYTPPGTTLAKQLGGAMHDPEKQTLFEIYSGHGNSEEYRDWRAVRYDSNGQAVCPERTADYFPCCRRAGEIIRSRCANPQSDECERRVRQARRHYAEAGASGYLTVPGADAADWQDCGQCRDCFLPAFNFRPGNSGQYALAVGNFDGSTGEPRHFRFGFIASSDNHSARPGTGYKEYARRAMTEAIGTGNAAARRRVVGTSKPEPESISAEEGRKRLIMPFLRYDIERQASFFMTGGLVAVHSAGRDRNAIWQALKRKEVYGTSGPRILLWFDLLNAPGGEAPMGSEVALAGAPRFRVRAVGSFKQKPGCPDYSLDAVGPQRLEKLCRGECYNPGDERYVIKRIEVVRVRPQREPGEALGRLIDDPWLTHACAGDPAGCAFEFDDPELLGSGREAVYYVRAVQEATPAVNAGGARCEYDAQGNCAKAHPCYGDYRTPFDDDCLSDAEERAWSSPIFVRPPAAERGAPPGE